MAAVGAASQSSPVSSSSCSSSSFSVEDIAEKDKKGPIHARDAGEREKEENNDSSSIDRRNRGVMRLADGWVVGKKPKGAKRNGGGRKRELQAKKRCGVAGGD